MDPYDMDQARAARAEERGEDVPTFVFGGTEFSLLPEMPLTAGEALERGDYRKFMDVMLDAQADKFFEMEPTLEDLRGMTEWLGAVYIPGVALGESSPSSTSSRPTSGRSKRTSKPPTESN